MTSSSLQYAVFLRAHQQDASARRRAFAAQLRNVSSLATRDGLTVVGRPLRDKSSGTEPDRKIFHDLMGLLYSRTANAILCSSLDRLGKHPHHIAALAVALERGALMEIRTPHETIRNDAESKLRLAIAMNLSGHFAVQRRERRARAAAHLGTTM